LLALSGLDEEGLPCKPDARARESVTDDGRGFQAQFAPVPNFPLRHDHLAGCVDPLGVGRDRRGRRGADGGDFPVGDHHHAGRDRGVVRPAAAPRTASSCQDSLHDVATDVGKPEVAALIAGAETLVAEPSSEAPAEGTEKPALAGNSK